MEDQIWNSIIKRLTAQETEDSKSMLDQWLNADAENQKLFQQAATLWQMTDLLPLINNENQQETVKPEVSTRYLTRISRYAIAASILVASMLSVYYFTRSKETETSPLTTYKVYKAENGKVMKLVLPDSSQVYLNSGSELSYPSDFKSGNIRLVKLIGEAFFDVTHNEKQAFVVESRNLKTTVYGTSFNVSAYPDKTHSAVVVKTGKVGVNLLGDSLSKANFLLPGNRLVYHHKTGKIEKDQVHIAEISNWLNGDLIFDQTPLNEVFVMLERKFDVTFNYDPQTFQDCQLTARFPNQQLDIVLKTIALTLDFKYKQQGRTIEIMGGKPCK